MTAKAEPVTEPRDWTFRARVVFDGEVTVMAKTEDEARQKAESGDFEFDCAAAALNNFEIKGGAALMSETKLTPCYIFDIDGTVADCSHRLHHIQKEPRDWDAFYGACAGDAPIKYLLRIADRLAHFEPVIFVSGRREECRDATEAWLQQYLFHAWPTKVYLRPIDDHSDDDALKIELLKLVRADGFEPIMAFEDRKRVVDAWRAAGIPCAQVAPGDF